MLGWSLVATFVYRVSIYRCSTLSDSRGNSEVISIQTNCICSQLRLLFERPACCSPTIAFVNNAMHTARLWQCCPYTLRIVAIHPRCATFFTHPLKRCPYQPLFGRLFITMRCRLAQITILRREVDNFSDAIFPMLLPSI